MLVVTSIKAYRSDFERTEEGVHWGGILDVRCRCFPREAAHITWQTSLPVFNQFLEPLSPLLAKWGESWNSQVLLDLSKHNLAPGTDLDQTYHLVQVPLAVLIMAVMGLAQTLKNKSTNMKTVAKNLFYATASIVGTGALIWAYPFEWWELPRVALLFTALFAVFSNADYILRMARGKWKQWGSPVATWDWLGDFGAVLSTSQKDIISQNQIGDISTLNEELNNREDLLIMEGDTLHGAAS